jgi:hypothetical protein
VKQTVKLYAGALSLAWLRSIAVRVGWLFDEPESRKPANAHRAKWRKFD